MSRRHRAEKREILPDAKFGDRVLTKFMNNLMYDGKKSVAEGIVYGALDASKGGRREPVEVFHEALDNVKPAVEVRAAASAARPIRCRSRCAPSAARRWRSAG
jgi:small subunit ribosomal protein S7